MGYRWKALGQIDYSEKVLRMIEYKDTAYQKLHAMRVWNGKLLSQFHSEE
jgi:hypothetical protein